MRKRDEIEASAEQQMAQLRIATDYALGRLMELELESLLDIRELLSTPTLDFSGMSKKELQEFLDKWHTAQHTGNKNG